MNNKAIKEVYMIVTPEGGFLVDLSGRGTCYTDKEKAQKALDGRNKWSKVRGYGVYALATLEVQNG